MDRGQCCLALGGGDRRPLAAAQPPRGARRPAEGAEAGEARRGSEVGEGKGRTSWTVQLEAERMEHKEALGDAPRRSGPRALGRLPPR